MSRLLRMLVSLILLALITAGSCQAAMLKAGVAKVDITPATGLPMWGYFDRKTPSQGTLDPLYARVLVLEAGQTGWARYA